MRPDHYDSFAHSYSRDNESGLFNAHYERPAMINLAGEVHGRRVLDAGCGSGALSCALRAKGALVTTSLSRSCCTTSRTGRHRCPSCGAS